MKYYHYPFCAVVGQSALKQALILSAIDSKLGGVLISGPRGMGKTTLARGLGDLLSNHSLTPLIPPFVTLPLGATEEKLVGSLDIERVLANGEVAFSPGLLARAHNGILYVDEVNLLPDHLVDLLLDVAASGVNHVERDGISQEHAAKFVLIGTMNPDEGELRPQLLDRFGLFVNISEHLNPQERVKAVKQRLAFDDNPALFIESVSRQQQQLHDELICAQALLTTVVIEDSEQLKIAEICAASGAEGLRADITLQRAAKAQAAWQGETRVNIQHINAVEEFVLAHRRNAAPQPPQSPSDPQPPQSRSDQSTSPDDSQPSSPQGKSAYSDRGSRFQQPRTRNETNNQSEHNTQKEHNENEGNWGAMTQEAAETLGRRIIDKAEFTGKKSILNNAFSIGQKGLGKSKATAQAAGQRSQIEKAQRVSWVPTLVDADNIRQLRTKDNANTPALKTLHYLKPQQKPGQLSLILIDSSASTGSHQSLGKAKGVVTALSHQCYLDRHELAIIEFGNNKVSTRLHPQRAPKVIEPVLESIKLGGGTPLRKALIQAREMLQKSRSRYPNKELVLYLLTDGRTNDDLSGLSSIYTTIDATIVVIDTEQQAIRLGRCQNIATQLHAQYLHIEDLPDHMETNQPQIKGASL